MSFGERAERAADGDWGGEAGPAGARIGPTAKCGLRRLTGPAK